MLFKVLVYAYTIGLRSSRKIADRLNEDLVFMWLAGRQTPDFRIIADFRKDKLVKESIAKQVDDIFREADEIDRQEEKLYGDSTDKDATFMMMKEGHIASGYNAQFAIEHQVILGYGLTSDRNDFKQLKPMVKEVEANTGKKPEMVTADAGYGRKMNYRYLWKN